MIEPLKDINKLNESFMKIRKASGWKEGTQLYQENLLFNLSDLAKRISENRYVPSDPYTFLWRERGKQRAIESYVIEDRIVQRCFTYYVLLPLVRKKIIYDNDASLEGRGTSHFRNRLSYKLKRYAKKHGNDGYVLIGDFSKFFDNIHHDVFIRCLKEMGADEEVLNFTKLILDAHRIDVSYMSDNEYKTCMEKTFDAIEYIKIDKSLLIGKKMMAKSVGIGSHLAQLSGVVVPYRLDNYIKIVKGCKDYARYNDDFYVIHQDKEFLKKLLVEIEIICKDLGITLNKKKTQIIPLRHRFTLLQTQYFITDSGKVVEIPVKRAYKRERNRLRGLHRKYINGQIRFSKIQEMYMSWRGMMLSRKGSYVSVKSVDNYFEKLFAKPYDYKVIKRELKREDLFNW